MTLYKNNTNKKQVICKIVNNINLLNDSDKLYINIVRNIIYNKSILNHKQNTRLYSIYKKINRLLINKLASASSKSNL